MGAMTLRMGKPNKIIIGEQIEHVLQSQAIIPGTIRLLQLVQQRV